MKPSLKTASLFMLYAGMFFKKNNLVRYQNF